MPVAQHTIVHGHTSILDACIYYVHMSLVQCDTNISMTSHLEVLISKPTRAGYRMHMISLTLFQRGTSLSLLNM